MRDNFRAALAAGLLAVSLFSCGDDDDDDRASVPAARGISLPQQNSDVYRADCQPYSGLHGRGDLTLNPDSSVIYRFFYFKDPACTDRHSEAQFIGTYSLRENGTRLDLTATSGTLRPLADDFTTALNAENYCGLTWSTGFTQELSTGSCWAEVRTANWEITDLSGDGSRIQVVSRDVDTVDTLIFRK